MNYKLIKNLALVNRFKNTEKKLFAICANKIYSLAKKDGNNIL